MDFVEACLDEIALEGLDGITLSALWIRLNARRPSLSITLDDTAKEYLWSGVIRGNEDVEFFELPKPRPPLVLYDRFKHSDPETGVIVRSDDHPENIYPICVIKDDPGGIMGSCLDFQTRLDVTGVVRDAGMDLNSVLQRWGEKFVIVASQCLRSMALFGCRQVDPDALMTITDIKYAILERIGRSRYHGEVTQSRDGLKVFKMQPKSVFYIRKILRVMGLITVQPVSIRSPQAHSINGKLIHLTRFHTEFRPKYMVLLEELTTLLAAKPNEREMLAQIRSEMGLKEKTFKKLMNLAKNNVRSELMKFSDAYPDATAIAKKSKNGGERSVRMLQLMKPYSPTQDDEDDDDNGKFGSREKDDESEKDSEELDLTVTVGKELSSRGPSTSLVCERPMLHQVLTSIEVLGGRGQSLMDIATRFGITKLDGRTICRNLSRKGCTVAVMKDEGKNRVSRYVSKRAMASAASGVATRLAEEASREAEDGVTSLVENKEDICLGSIVAQTMKSTPVMECEAVTADEKEKQELLKLLEVFPDSATIRSLRRAKTVLTAVEQARVVSDSVLIQKKIRLEEGQSSVMDRKSLMRLIDKLCAGNKIRRIVHTLQMLNGQNRELMFLCLPSVTDDDHLVQSALEAARQKLITTQSEPTSQRQHLVTKVEGAGFNDDAEEGSFYDVTACKRYGYLSRMARLRTLHQLLWSLVYGRREDVLSAKDPPTVDKGQATLQTAHETTYSLLCEDFYTTPEADERANDALVSRDTKTPWRDTLPQLPKHSGYDDGWCCVFDVLQVAPISVICQIVSIPFAINGLESFLSDPITSSTPFNKLPIEWRKIISRKRRYITHFYSDCKSLAMLGLLTFGRRDFKAKEQCYVYVHKRATLVNTTHLDVPRSEFPVCPFYFETFAHVEDYWLSLQSLSFNTPRENLLPFSKQKLQNTDGRFDACLMEREVGSVVDSGVIPGNGMGGAGTDSTFFSHLRRNWSRNTGIDVKIESMIDDDQYNMVEERARTPMVQAKTKKKKQAKLHAPSDVQLKSGKSGKTKSDPNVKFTKEVVTGVFPKKGGKGVKRKRNGVVEGLLKKSKRVREKRVQSTDEEKLTNADGEKSMRRRKHDTKDVDAIRLLKRHRVTWTPQEDSLLLLCQLTNQFLSGYQKLCLVGNAVIRDIMHANLSVSRDKTRLACVRRIKYMMKNSATIQNVQMYLGEALQDKELTAEFKNGRKYAMIKNSAENEPVFKRCLAMIREKFRCENECVQDIPNTPAELAERLSDVKCASHGKSIHEDVTSVSEIFYSVLHNLIHSAIVLTDKIGRSRELFQLLYQYPESVVESVFKSMKNDRMLTKIKKSVARKSRCGGIPLTRFGTFQISQRYMYYWHTNFVRNIFAVVGSSMLQFPPSPDDSSHGSDFLVLRNTDSHSVVAVTLMSLRSVTFETTIPEQIVVIDTVSKENKTVDRPKKKKPKLDVDDESDLEEEALIEGAERDRTQETSAQDNPATSDPAAVVDATPSVIMYNKSQSSRTVLSYYRCQYVHSKTIRDINPNDNIVINACDVRIRLKPTEVRDVNGNCETTWATDIEAHRMITDWNRSHVMLHPKTCQMILKSIRTVYPDRARSSLLLDVCLARSKDWGHLMSIYEEIRKHEYLGITIYQLRETFSGVNGCELNDHLAIMVDCKLVVRVGVTVFRYVCLEFASSWLIRIDKNLKGRGVLCIDEEEDVTIEPLEVIPSGDDTSSSASASASSSATNTCSSPISRSRTSLLSTTDSESSLQFVPSPIVAARKRAHDEKIGEDVEASEGDRMEEPPFKCLKVGEEVCRDVPLQLSDKTEALNCAEVTRESVAMSEISLQTMEGNLEPSLESVCTTEETFVTDAVQTVVEISEPLTEHEASIGETLETESLRVVATASDDASSSGVSCPVSPKVRRSDFENETETILSNAITSDLAKLTSDSLVLSDDNGIVCSSGVSVSQTLADVLPSLPASVEVADISEQLAVVTESDPGLMPESASLISSPQMSNAASHTSKSPASVTTNVADAPKFTACEDTPSASPSNMLADQNTPVSSISKSPVSKSASISSASKSQASEDTSSSSTLNSLAGKSNPAADISNLLADQSTPVTSIPKSPVPKSAPVTSIPKSPVPKRAPVTSASKSRASKSTPASKTLKSSPGKTTPTNNTSKSHVRKMTPVTSASKSPACKTPSDVTASQSPDCKGTPVIPPFSSPVTRRGLATRSSTLPEPDTKMVSINAETSPSIPTKELSSNGNEKANESPITTDATDDSYYSSLINSVPKVLKRPSYFLKTRQPSDRQGQTTPRSPRPIRLPSWMPPAKEIELANDVQKSDAVSVETQKTRVRRNVANIASSAAIVSNSNSSLSSPSQTTPDQKSSISTPHTDSIVESSQVLSPVSSIPRPQSPKSTTARPNRPVVDAPGRKTLPVVRMATSGTCTTITVLSPEKPPNQLDRDATKAEKSPIRAGSNVPTNPSPSLSTMGHSTVVRNSGTPRTTSDAVHGSAVEFRSDVLPMRSSYQSLRYRTPVTMTVGTSPTSAHCVPGPSPIRFSRGPAVGSPQFSSPSRLGVSPVPTPRGQSIRIRVAASSLGSVSGTSELARQIQEMLLKQGSLQPGQQVRLRLPPGVTLQTLGLAGTPQSPSQCVVTAGQCVVSAGQPVTSSSQLLPGNSVPRGHAGSMQEANDGQAGMQSAGELSHFRLPQVDGASDENSTTVGADNLDNDAATDHATENGLLQHSDAAITSDNGEQMVELCPTQPENAQDGSETPLLEDGIDRERGNCSPPASKGTYKKVRLIPRPWRTPEGTVNRPTLRTMLEAVMLFVIETPGVTRGSLVEKYTPVLQPVAIFELLEMLEEIGCLQRTFLHRSHAPALFSSRSRYQIVAEDSGKETEVYRPTPGCIVKLGQFITQLTSGERKQPTS